MTRLGRGTVGSGSFFASSLLSLISPWGRSRAARSHRSRTRWPRPVAPPPPPRRHSAPNSVANSIATNPTNSSASAANRLNNNSTNSLASVASCFTYNSNRSVATRRHSEVNSKMDLRQELMGLMDNEEATDWLGNVQEMDRFEHDVMLQRSVSLDRGVDIFNYLQSVESDLSESVASSWSVDSERTFQYRSLEDTSTSHKVKSRRVSCTDANFRRPTLGLEILRNSYKVIDMSSGDISPQIKQLQKTFSFKHLTENISTDILNEDRVPFVRSVSVATKIDDNVNEDKSVRQRKKGIQNMEYLKDLRKEVLRNSINFKSCDNVSSNENRKKLRRVSDPKDETSIGFNTLKNSYKGELISPTKSINNNNFCRSSTERCRYAPTIHPTNTVSDSVISSVVISDKNTSKVVENFYQKFNLGASGSNETKHVYEPNLIKLYLEASNIIMNNSKAKKWSSNSSKSVDVSSSCFCQICREVIDKESLLTSNLNIEPTTSNPEVPSNPIEISSCRCLICKENEDKTSYLSRSLTKIFMDVVLRKIWDENNNFTEKETVSSVIQVMKLLFGLWLRHLDHKGTQSTKT